MSIKDGYELWHKLREDDIYMEEPEYYQLIGSLIRGTKSVDIGCGFGTLEFFSPDTVGVDFSEEALKKAREMGVKNLVQASAANMPFKDNEFELAVSLGTLEHVPDIDAAIKEIVRVSEMQILVVHAALPYILEVFRKPLKNLFGLKEQPHENPQTLSNLKKLLKKHGSRVLIEGVWNYIDPRWISKKLKYGSIKIPSHYIVMSMKTPNLERRFLGDLDKSQA